MVPIGDFIKAAAIETDLISEGIETFPFGGINHLGKCVSKLT